MSLAEISHKLQGPYNPKDFNLVGKRTKKEDLYKFVKVFKSLVYSGKHDQGFVNFYDIKKEFRKGHETFQDLIQSVIYSRRALGLKNFNVSNIVWLIDRRPRFKVYTFLSHYEIALKIRLE